MPGEYKVCLQLLDKMPRHPESQKYIEFLEATGAEHIGNFTRWAYFRKKSKDGEFELFSDNASRIKYLSGVISSIALITVANCIVGINNVFFGYQSFQFGELFRLYKSCHWNFGNLWLYQAAKKTQKNETRMSIV